MVVRKAYGLDLLSFLLLREEVNIARVAGEKS